MNLFASSRFFLKLTMIASFQKTTLKIGDIIIKVVFDYEHASDSRIWFAALQAKLTGLFCKR